MSAPTSDVQVRDNPEESRYEAWVGDRLAGFVVYRIHDGVVDMLHTEVGEDFGGMGVGSALARQSLDDVRRGPVGKVRPSCPFIHGWIEKHPDYADLVG